MSNSNETIYEFAYLLRLGEDKQDVLTTLTAGGATMVFDGGVKMTELAYEIEKQGSAQFGFCQLTLDDPSRIAELTKVFNLKKESVLRFMFVKLPSEATGKEVASSEDASDETVAPRIDTLSNEKLEESIEKILQ